MLSKNKLKQQLNGSFNLFLLITFVLSIYLLTIVSSIDSQSFLNYDESNLDIINRNKISYEPYKLEHLNRKRRDTTTKNETIKKDKIKPKKIINRSSIEDLNGINSLPPEGISKLLSKSLSLSEFKTHYDAREISQFLESHPAHSIHDPRAYFTEERTTRSLAIILKEFKTIPYKLRFAYLVRVFNELGRKIATKLNYYSSELIGILKKNPDDLGNKPDVSMLVDVINNAFDSKEDNDIKEYQDEFLLTENTITKLIKDDNEKKELFNLSLIEIAKRFAHIITYFTFEVNKTSLLIPNSKREFMSLILSESLQMGCLTMIKELSNNDKFKVFDEIVLFTDKLLSMTLKIFHRHIMDLDNFVELNIKNLFNSLNNLKSFKDLNFISDKTGLIGPWNSYLFSNLGSTERIIKLFSSLLARVPINKKSRWINMYIAQINLEIEKTISAFVFQQGMPNNNINNKLSSDYYLLFNKTHSSMKSINNDKINYMADKNKIPARCYLAGRRWRLLLTKSLNSFPKRDDLLKQISDIINKLKLKLTNQSGNEIYRLCLPRVEVGLKGYSINGEPNNNDAGIDNKFPLKNPIENLDSMKDPFLSGVDLGYILGFKIGFNEERNATLEMEINNNDNSNNNNYGSIKNQRLINQTIDNNKKLYGEQIARASYRKATTIAAKKAFEIALHEGYLTAIKVSMRAGIQILTETASKMATLKCINFGGLVGLATGRSIAENYIQDKINELNESDRKNLIEIGEKNGELAGKSIGELIALIVGSKSAEEAYKRHIIRGGKVSRAKFHLEEFEAGANLALDYGLNEGKRMGSSASLDPSAPNFLRFTKPTFSFDNSDNNNNQEVDHWENELIPKLSDKVISELQNKREHKIVSGSLKGIYKVAKEIKNGFQRQSYSNLTYELEVFANGFIMNDVAYLTLNGTVNKLGPLRGSLIAKDIFNDNYDN